MEKTLYLGLPAAFEKDRWLCLGKYTETRMVAVLLRLKKWAQVKVDSGTVMSAKELLKVIKKKRI